MENNFILFLLSHIAGGPAENQHHLLQDRALAAWTWVTTAAPRYSQRTDAIFQITEALSGPALPQPRLTWS